MTRNNANGTVRQEPCGLTLAEDLVFVVNGDVTSR